MWQGALDVGRVHVESTSRVLLLHLKVIAGRVR